MLIPEVSQIGARTPFNGRSTVGERARRPSPSRSEQAPAEPPEDNAEDGDEADELSPEQGMTLAAAQAAYAST